ncbi:hypothetical protein GCM10022258_41440 [Aquimarina gracilis]
MFCFGITLQAQTKFEREYRIKKHEAPKAAVAFISKGFSEKKVKWYVEESQDGKTFEAKTNYKKNKYSIEFDTLGNILDIEKKVSFQSLQNVLKSKIISSLNSLFVKHKILKVQIQWKGDQENLLKLIKDTKKENYSELYEIVIKGKKQRTFKMYEILFDSEGKALKVLEIIQRPSDNLEL